MVTVNTLVSEGDVPANLISVSQRNFVTATSAVYMVQVTSAELGLHSGNVKLCTLNTESKSRRIILRKILPSYLSMYHLQ
jgi:hypothetical protein